MSAKGLDDKAVRSTIVGRFLVRLDQCAFRSIVIMDSGGRMITQSGGT